MAVENVLYDQNGCLESDPRSLDIPTATTAGTQSTLNRGCSEVPVAREKKLDDCRGVATPINFKALSNDSNSAHATVYMLKAPQDGIGRAGNESASSSRLLRWCLLVVLLK